MRATENRVSASLPEPRRVEAGHLVDHRDHARKIVGDHRRLAVAQDLRHRAAAHRDDGCAAGQRLDHDEAERLLPLDRHDQRMRPGEQLALLVVVDLADVADVVVQVGCDELVEVGDLARLAALGGDLERPAEALRDADRAVRALVGAHAAEEEERVAGIPVDLVARDVDRVVDVCHPRQVGQRATLVHGQRDEPGMRHDLADLAVDVARVPVSGPWTVWIVGQDVRPSTVRPSRPEWSCTMSNSSRCSRKGRRC